MINIQDIIPFMKDGWVACDKNGNWCYYAKKPEIFDITWTKGYGDITPVKSLSDIFNIAPADDWTKSLIKLGGK